MSVLDDETRELERLVGTQVDGRYRIKSIIGVGGMGGVFLAEHEGLRRDVALKILRPSISSQLTRARFAREAAAISCLNHPNCVRVSDYGTHLGMSFMAMEFLNGRDLRSVETHTLPLATAVEIARQVTDGLSHAHARGIIHRDLKLANVFLTEDHRGRPLVKLIDFGIAKCVAEESGSRLTRTGDVFGTPGCMSPEQARGEETDHRTDLFGVGVVLYRLFVGERPPLLSMNPARYTEACQAGLHGASLPPRLQSFIVSLLSLDPSARPGSARVALRTITAISHGVEDDAPTAIPHREARQVPASLPVEDLPPTTPPELSPSLPDTRGLHSGAYIDGRFVVERVIGSGAISFVCLATDRQTARPVALKVLTDASSRPAAMTRFRLEAAVLGTMRSRHIVAGVAEGALPDGRHYLAMEHVPGPTLAELAGAKDLTRSEIWGLLIQLAAALAHMHARGVVHRDLKPDNIVVEPAADPHGAEARLVVVDFSLAACLAGVEHRLTTGQAVLGTPGFMPPEQVRADPPAPTMDVYAFGVVACWLLTGRLPIHGCVGDDRLRTDGPLHELVEACLRSNPGERPSDGAALVQRLRAGQARGHGRRDVCPTYHPRPMPRMMAALVVTLLGCGVIGMVHGQHVVPGQVDHLDYLDHDELVGAGLEKTDGREIVDTWRSRSRPTIPLVATRQPPPPRASPGEHVRHEVPSPVDASEPQTSERPNGPASGAPSCGRVRRRAREARTHHAWKELLRLASRRRCWADDASRTRLMVQANAELHDFSACLEAASGSEDPEVVRWRRICKARRPYR